MREVIADLGRALGTGDAIQIHQSVLVEPRQSFGKRSKKMRALVGRTA
jgi:hypothetical protein